MIAGVVSTEHEATIGLTLIGDEGQQVRVQAVIDTGFDGWLLLPRTIIEELRYAWLGRNDTVLADGSATSLNAYEGYVVWDRRRRTIYVHEADSTPLVGMGLLKDHELNIQVRNGGSVTIRRLPKEQ